MVKLFKWSPGLLVIIGGIITILMMTTEIRAFSESLAASQRYPIYRDILKILSPVVLIYEAARIVGVVVALLGILLLWRPSFLTSIGILFLSGLLFNWIGFLFGFIGGVVGMIVAHRTAMSERGKIEKLQVWVQNETGGAIQSMRHLQGSTSSILYEMKTEKSTVVLRQFNHEEWLKEEPDLVRHEAESLQAASTGGLPSPRLLATDETGETSGAPSVLMTKVEGDVELLPTDFNKWTDGLAKVLVAIHQVEANGFPWKYKPYTKREDVKIPQWSKKPAVWQAAFERLHEAAPEFQETFIHRDFHPANILWKNGEVSGIVDWPNACLGPVGIDVGHCRVNLALLHGTEVADLFLALYVNYAGPSFTYYPYWDLVSAFDFLDGPPTVYSGWEAFGVSGLTDSLMEERMDAFVESLVLD